MPGAVSLDGKTAIITGAASGIGKSIAKVYVEHGISILIADINNVRGKATAKELGKKASFTHCDISSPPEVRVMMEKAFERFNIADISLYHPCLTAQCFDLLCCLLSWGAITEKIDHHIRSLAGKS